MISHSRINAAYLRFNPRWRTRMETEKNFTTLKALVPLKEMGSYSTTLSSLTGGRATFTMKFKSYELVPGDVQDKLIKEYEATQKDED